MWCLTGVGVYTYANGNIYDGEFREDLKHGSGSFKSAFEYSYVGDWENDLRQGVCMLCVKIYCV